MPEYLALTHYHEATSDQGEPAEEWTPDELDQAFLRAARSGVLTVN